MFSIENLAWADAPQKIGLDPCEIGPNGGRIMWFPPYDITFTDNTTANWNSEIFIGRAEPIYTYNHTERKGTLSWSIITDHPSALNSLKQKQEQELWQFFAGCGFDTSIFQKEEKEVIEIEQEEEIEEVVEEIVVEEIIDIPKPKEPPVTELSFYFRNATSDYGVKGRKGPTPIGRSIEEELAVDYDTGVKNNISKTKKGDYLFLNKEWVEKIDSLIDFLATPEGQNYCVEFNGYCSALSTNNYNQILSIDRANRVANYVISKVKEKGEAGPPPPGGVDNSSRLTAVTEYYVYDEKNFSRADYGYKCLDGGPNGVSGDVQDGLPESAYYKKNLTNIDLTKCSETVSKYSSIKKRKGYWWVGIKDIPKPTDDTILSKNRWSVAALSEDYARDVDEDNDGIESEGSEGTTSVTSQNSATRSNYAKEDRAVHLRVFKNHERINNTVAAKNNPEKLIGGDNVDESLLFIEPLPVVDLTKPKQVDIPILGGGGGVQTLNFNSNGQLVDENGVLLSTIQDKPKLSRKERRQQKAFEDVFKTANINSVASVLGGFGPTKEEEDGLIGENVDDEEVKEIKDTTKTIKRNVQRLFKECQYFEAIKESDPFIYEGIKEKIKFFHPAFHSTTPEGLNSRLTFLHQCMRQGPSLREGLNQTQNMAFGKPPILVLKIGDFYHTKIVPDSLNVNYEPLQWDMNPEGIGVQPMIAKIDLNFSFIGGSSLDGPIKQLQNAVSFNFLANTSIYNPRRYYEGTVAEHPDKDGKYSINKTGNWQSLEQRLEGLAEESTLDSNQLLVGYGAFKNQTDANRERYTPLPEKELIKMAEDSKTQDLGLNSQDSKPDTNLPVPPIIDIDSDGIPDTIDGEITASPIDAPEDPTAFLTQGLFGNSEDQQMIKDMFPGARTPEDDLAEIDNYEVTFTNLNKSITLPSIAGSIPSTIWLNTLFPNPDGTGGVTLQWATFSIKNFELGWLVKNEVELKLTYPDGTIEEFSDSSYVLTTFPNKEEIIVLPPYADYNTLNTGPNEASTSSIFQIEEFFTDWFTKDSRTNGTHKLEVTWTYNREVTSDNVEAVATSVGVGTQSVGQLVNKTHTETFEYDLYSEEYPPYPEEVANILAGLPPGAFFP